MFQVKQLRWRYLKKFPAARRLSRKIRMFMATLSHSRQHSGVPTYSYTTPALPHTAAATPFRDWVCVTCGKFGWLPEFDSPFGGLMSGCAQAHVSVCVCECVFGECDGCVYDVCAR